MNEELFLLALMPIALMVWAANFAMHPAPRVRKSRRKFSRRTVKPRL